MNAMRYDGGLFGSMKLIKIFVELMSLRNNNKFHESFYFLAKYDDAAFPESTVFRKEKKVTENNLKNGWTTTGNADGTRLAHTGRELTPR